jgi:hypothetical protein
MALPSGFLGLCTGLILAGIGSSMQHPRASHLVTYGTASRGPLGICNFAGDLGWAARYSRSAHRNGLAGERRSRLGKFSRRAPYAFGLQLHERLKPAGSLSRISNLTY